MAGASACGGRGTAGGPREARARLRFETAVVERRRVAYGVGGHGTPVVFLHGWGLGWRAYRAALERLAAQGARVVAPALPGFGGSEPLPACECSFAGYAAWLDGFLAALSPREPAVLVGHSFGGGVAIRAAHDFPDRVVSLVLLDAIGVPVPASPPLNALVRSRPLCDWGRRLPLDVLALDRLRRVVPAVAGEALGNLVRDPVGMWRTAEVARQADLTAELEVLRERGVPAFVLWGREDRLLPRETFEVFCDALGAEGELVEGGHAWPISDPELFAEAVAGGLGVSQAEPRQRRRARALEAADRRRGGRLVAG